MSQITEAGRIKVQVFDTMSGYQYAVMQDLLARPNVHVREVLTRAAATQVTAWHWVTIVYTESES